MKKGGEGKCISLGPVELEAPVEKSHGAVASEAWQRV